MSGEREEGGGRVGGEADLTVAGDAAGGEGAVHLPVVSPSGEGGAGVPGPPAEEPGTSSVRLVGTLALAGALAGMVIVMVDQWTRPAIEAHQAEELAEAVYEVLGGPDRYQTAFLVDGGFTLEPPPASDTMELERVYVGFDPAGRAVGVAVPGAEPGFQDVIHLIFGYDPAAGEVIGMKVLDNKETPGLGDGIVKDSAFISEFAGVLAPLEGVKAARATGADHEVDMITGATISSRAVIDIINHRLDALGPSIGTFWSAGVTAPPAPAAAAGGAP